MEKSINIIGAREHNLRNISLEIPRDRFVVITGLSGSGKSSLAFDTLYAEGQRRYLESLSAYARQFLEQLKKPDVDFIDGLSPAISIEQKNVSRNPRSTVGTITEIYDFLRLLYARVGVAHCPNCSKPIKSQTIQQIVDTIMTLPQGTKFSVLAPIVRGKKGEYQKELLEFRSQGFVRANIDGNEVSLSTPVKLKKNLKHDISIYVDRLILKEGIQSRLAEALEISTKHAVGLCEISIHDSKESRYYSTKFACADCGVSFLELEPRSFSFNSPHGACPQCNGIGYEEHFDPSSLVSDSKLSLKQGAIDPVKCGVLTWKNSIWDALAEKYDFSVEEPFEKLTEKIQLMLFYGSGTEEIAFEAESKIKSRHVFKQVYQGIIPALKEMAINDPELIEPGGELRKFLTVHTCNSCFGTRLKKEMLSVLLDEKNISEVSAMNVETCIEFLRELKLSESNSLIAKPILKELQARLSFLMNVGLSYLTLDRAAGTLSGGESQRIRLATQIGSNLIGVLYILDEPSIGLHQRDNQKLINALIQLRDQGNSVLVVEHDEETILASDYVVDLGPGAGVHGGNLVFAGSPKELIKCQKGLTGKYLSGKRSIEVPLHRRVPQRAKVLSLINANTHNLKNITVHFPLGLLICVTGVSGSGKSSLVIDTLLPWLENNLYGQRHYQLPACKIEGLNHLDKVVHVNQSPIGRSPRSNPATYTGVFGDIRLLFSETPESKARGYTLSRFSFNIKGGRCEACKGDGNNKITMHFMPDVFVECENCNGKRYNRETLEVLYRGKNISEVLNMTVEEALSFFDRIPSIKSKMKTLVDVGLGYITVGQSSVTLSGGEAQRIKLAKELNRRATGRTIYILDEPTTGLHFEDVKCLLQILQALVNQGNTIIVIEHNLDVIKQADYIIDLGPEGGEQGGRIVFEGSPEELANSRTLSYTGQYLAKVLQKQATSSKNQAHLNRSDAIS